MFTFIPELQSTAPTARGDITHQIFSPEEWGKLRREKNVPSLPRGMGKTGESFSHFK